MDVVRNLLLVLIVILSGNAVAEAADQLQPPPLPILPPSALTADAGDGRAYLRWNLQIEDERITGWKVLQLQPQEKVITADALTEPHYVVRDLQNGTACTFAVAGVLKDGSLTRPGNTVTVVPHDVGVAKVEPIRRGQKITVGEFKDIELTGTGAKVIFPDGQELLYDHYRPVDWKTADGQHLLYPKVFGNNLDIGKFDDRGLPLVIPPDGQEVNEEERVHSPKEILPANYQYAQKGTRHPYITDPLTMSLQEYHHDAPNKWFEPVVDGNRVTFHYWQPVRMMRFKAWVYVMVWETWWPIDRDRHGTTYRGLARLVEVQLPSVWKYGYQVMLNNGFGPGGSRESVVSYSSGFRSPGREIVDFSGDKNQAVTMQYPKPPRRGYGYHPNQDCLQCHPLIFYDWGAGSLTIAARSLYYHCANNSSSYVENGADGVWPNLAWDLGRAGKRMAVDTVEYLFTADRRQPLPQRYLNARFETYHNVSRRMGVQSQLATTSWHQPFAEVRTRGTEGFARHYVEWAQNKGVNGIGAFVDFWQAAPAAVPAAYRLDPSYDCNPKMRAMASTLQAAGLSPGFWFRGDVTKTAIPNLLSDTMPTASTNWTHSCIAMPDVVSILEKQGIKTVREHPEMIRRTRDGDWPYRTPYQWTPMSFANGWLSEIIWPALNMSKQLGYNWILLDGGFGGMQGVDYSPMLAGKSDYAVPVQPYWWQMFRSMNAIDIRLNGECTAGWVGGNVDNTGKGDENFLWMFHLGLIYGNNSIKSPQDIHKLYQLYTSNRHDVGSDAVRRYAAKFYAQHPVPDWVELKNLRQGEPVKVEFEVKDSPVAGNETKAARGEDIIVRPWIWDDAVWHYDDGTQVVYPAYDKIDWEKE